MRQVRIGELKARLSEYLRAVRSGETIAVVDRATPVARLIPIRERETLNVRHPLPGTPAPNRVPLPKGRRAQLDIMEALLEERQAHR